LLPSDQQESVRWQADGFAEPLDFALDAVRHISFEPADDHSGRSPGDRTEQTPANVVDRSADRTQPESTPTDGAVGDDGGRSLRDRTDQAEAPTGDTTPTSGVVDHAAVTN